MDDRIVGVLGGGQLGRMLVEAAHRLNIKVAFLDAPNAPAKQINALQTHVNGSFSKADDVRRLADICDILTVEIEHVDTKVLEEIAEGHSFTSDWRPRGGPKPVQPSWETIRLIQDKYVQKEHLIRHGIATAKSIPIDTPDTANLREIADKLGSKLMLKSRTEAYDGRGNFVVNGPQDYAQALEALKDRPLYAEQWAKFKMELAVMVVKTNEEDDVNEWKSSTVAFPVVETVHEDSICKLVYAPARGVAEPLLLQAQMLARRAVSTFKGLGVFGVEMFLLDDGTLLVNEIAPRPHNSGHYTIEACHMSQYEAHLRAILQIPIPHGSLTMKTPDTNAIMLNILGGSQPNSHILVGHKALDTQGASLHLYGKGDARPGRKMGHITLIASSMPEAEQRIQPLISRVDKIRAERNNPPQPSSTSPPKPKPSPTPLVAVTMGSDSDLPTLQPGLDLLTSLRIPFEVTIKSAHRTPQAMLSYASAAAPRGIRVIIAAAGGAAHLPGMIASSTPLPVIGVPVKGSVLDGNDSLLSIVQMPRGVPVATVGINNSVNAALLAARILGCSSPSEGREFRERVEGYAERAREEVVVKNEKMEAVGYVEYARQK